jgi:lysophospholipase L1-like esterase
MRGTVLLLLLLAAAAAAWSPAPAPASDPFWVRWLPWLFAAPRARAAQAARTGALAAAPFYPSNISACGDSITVGYDIKKLLATDLPDNWATGTSTGTNSVFSRLLAVNARAAVSLNVAVSGVLMANLNGQVDSILPTTQLVTILMGGNDLCTSTTAAMTSTASFSSSFRAALRALDGKLSDPRAIIYVASIPDVYQLWSLYRSNLAANLVWAAGSICQSLLANPNSNTAADVARRAAVRTRNLELNAALDTVCKGFSRCRFDMNATFTTALSKADVSSVDYFHPSVLGQAKLAKTAWCVLFPPPPGSPCV